MITDNNYIKSIKIDDNDPIKALNFYKNFHEIEFTTSINFHFKKYSEHTIVCTYSSAPIDIDGDKLIHNVPFSNSVIIEIEENSDDYGFIEYAYKFQINCEG